jgi:ligand-binding sensor domain-containing protein
MKILSKYTVLMITVAFAVLALPIKGQINAAFKHIKSENGLSSSNVKTIMQDSYGFMWFGTKNGLNRYDGNMIRQIDCDDKEKRVGNHNIGALYEDKSHNIWVGTDRGIYIYNPRKDSFRYVDVKSRNGVKPGNWVQEILGDFDGNIWVLIPDQGVFRFAGRCVDFYSITDKRQFKQQSPGSICLSGRDVWVGTSGVGIFRYDKERNRFEQHLVDRKGVSLKDKMITSMCTLRDELILGMTNGELIRYDYRLNEFTPIRFAERGRIDLRDIKAQGNEIWVGSQQGLYILNNVTGATQTVKEDPMNPFSLSDNIIYYIYFDSRGGAWLGTMFSGVDYMPRNKFQFVKYLPSGRIGSLSSKRIRGIAEDSGGNVWIGTEDAGINILRPGNREIRQIKVGTEANKSVIMVKYNGDNMVLGFQKSGLMSINTKTGTVSKREWYLGKGHNGVYSFLHDSRGRDWIGLGWGLYRRENAHAQFERINATGYDWIFDIAEDRAGCIWIATMGNGIWKYDIKRNVYKKYTCDTGIPNGLRSNSVSSIMQDRSGRVWFTTDRGGISCYCRAKDKFVTYGVAEGLPDDVAYNIVEDDAGNLWFGTNKGLVKFNPYNKSVRVFTTKDGLLGNQFNYGSAIRGRDGTFYFGGIDGLISFKPNLYNVKKTPEPIYVTQLYIFNKVMDANSSETLLDKNIIFADTLVLPYDKSNVAFDVSSMSYLTWGDSRYSYMMTPIDNEWVKMNDDHHISYSNLLPGKYVLKIRAVCGGKERVKNLVIIVLPPWWKTSWAYFGYIVILIVALVMWFLWYKAAKERQFQEKQKLFTIKKEKELYESKVEFFTEIAHEIRTPLTLIDSPLEAVEEIGVSDTKVQKYLKIMRQNTERLLDLSSQLLDFQKIDSRKLVLKNECVDVRQLLCEIVERFEPAYELQSKELITDIRKTLLWLLWIMRL